MIPIDRSQITGEKDVTVLPLLLRNDTVRPWWKYCNELKCNSNPFYCMCCQKCHKILKKKELISTIDELTSLLKHTCIISKENHYVFEFFEFLNNIKLKSQFFINTTVKSEQVFTSQQAICCHYGNRGNSPQSLTDWEWFLSSSQIPPCSIVIRNSGSPTGVNRAGTPDLWLGA